MRLTMNDGTLNYGYYAVVRGNSDATEDSSALRLYFRQDERQTQGKKNRMSSSTGSKAAASASIRRRR